MHASALVCLNSYISNQKCGHKPTSSTAKLMKRAQQQAKLNIILMDKEEKVIYIKNLYVSCGWGVSNRRNGVTSNGVTA